MKAIALLIDDQLVRLLRQGRGWRPVATLSGRRCRLIVAARDEAVQSGQLPNIGLTDRFSLLERRLDNAYPGVAMRAAWMTRAWSRSPGYIMCALPDEAPAQAAARTLALEGARIGGVAISSDALWRLARREKAPLIGLFLPTSFRLLAVQDGLPMLTRWLALDDLDGFIVELRRTKSYLIRQKMLSDAAALVCYGQPPAGWQEALTSAWLSEGHIDWRGGEAIALLAGAPRGTNLAPAEWLRDHRSWLIGRSALAAGASLWVFAGAASVETLVEIGDIEAKVSAARRGLADQETRAAQMTEKLRTAGVAPELLRKAEAVENGHPASVATLEQDLVRLSGILEGADGLKLDSLDWRAASVADCGGAGEAQKSGASSAATPSMPAATPSKPGAGGENRADASGRRAADARVLEFVLRFPEEATLRQRARFTEAFANRLQDWQEAAVRVSPLTRLRSQMLKSEAKNEEAPRFCLEIGAPQRQARSPSP